MQSVAVRLIVDREREILAFVPKEYWSIEAELTPPGSAQAFRAKLMKIGTTDVGNGETCLLKSEAQVKPLLDDLAQAGIPWPG